MGRKIHEVDFDVSSLGMAVERLVEIYNVPVGFEYGGSAAQSAKPIKIRAADISLRDLLDGITSQDGRYRWKLVAGVINLYPDSEPDAIAHKLLELAVEDFSISMKARKAECFDRIFSLPEAAQMMRAANAVPLRVETNTLQPASERPDLKITFKDKSMREILNALVDKHYIESWYVARWDENPAVLVLNF